MHKGWCSGCCVFWGILLLLAGLLPTPLILVAVENKINSGVSIHSQTDDEQKFREWQSNDPTTNGRKPADQPANMWSYYFFNLTNPDFVQTGEPSRFVELGPYVYRQIINNYNVSFNADETEVTYQEWNRMTFDASLSGSGLSENDEITSLYFSYNALINSLGVSKESEFLVVAFSQQMINAFVSSFLAYCAAVNATDPMCADPMSAAAAQWGALRHFNMSFIDSPNVVDVLNQSLDGQKTLQIFQGIEFGFASYAEFGAIGNLSEETSMNLLYGNASAGFDCPWFNGSFVPPCPVVFAQLAVVNQSELLQKFPIPPSEYAQIPLLVQYLVQLSHAFAGTVLHSAKFAAPRSTLMFVKKTPAEALFHFVDPLLALHGVHSEAAYFPYMNQPDKDHAYEVWPWRKTLKTGKGSPSEAWRYVRWRDHDILPSRNGNLSNPGYWCDVDETVASYSQNQFPPGKAHRYMFESSLAKEDVLSVFVDSVYKKVDFQFEEDVEVKGIKAWRFRVADHEFNATPGKYSNNLPGIINLTCPVDAPLLVTLPHFNHVGSLPFPLPDIGAPDPAIHEVIFDIEPRTGTVLQGHNRLQINSISSILGNTTIFPLCWGDNFVILTDKNADDFKSGMSIIRSVQISLIVLIVVGGILFLSGVLLAVTSCKQEKPNRQMVPTQEMSSSSPEHV